MSSAEAIRVAHPWGVDASSGLAVGSHTLQVRALAGAELVRYLARHPDTRLVSATSEQSAGKSLADVLPSVRQKVDLRLAAFDPAAVASAQLSRTSPGRCRPRTGAAVADRAVRAHQSQ